MQDRPATLIREQRAMQLRSAWFRVNVLAMATKIADGMAVSWQRVQTKLARDKLSSAIGKPSARDRFVTTTPTWEAFLKPMLEREPADRWAALALAAEHAARGTYDVKGQLRVRSGLKFFAGDVVVRGDVILGPTAAIIASGDLRIEGNLIGDPSDYSLAAAGGTLRAAAVHTTGELFACKAIQIEGPAWLRGNDYFAAAPKLSAKVLLQIDRDDRLTRITAPKRWTGPLSSADVVETIAAWLELPGFDDGEELERAFTKRLVTGTRPKPRARSVPASSQQALVEAAKAQSAKRLDAAIAGGANPDSPGGAEALVLAAYFGAVDLVSRLLAAGAKPDRKDANGNFPLIAGAQHTAVVKLLLKAGANPNRRDDHGSMPLHQAWAVADSITALLNAGADPLAKDDVGRTAIHIVAESGDPPAIQAFVKRSASIEARDKRGRTPLWIACHRGWVPVASALLAANADPNAADQDGRTPLFAIATSRAEIDLKPLVSLLLRAGARADMRDRKRKLAHQVVSTKLRRDVIAALTPTI